MVTNERQYRITEAQLLKMKEAVAAFNINEVAERVGSKVLAKAELDALKSEVLVLSAQLRDYEALKSGAVTKLQAESLDELPNILIRARIAQGLSQRQLSDVLGLKEQQIQRYESEKYASASLRRLTEVAEALKLNIKEMAEIQPLRAEQESAQKKDIPWELFPVKEMYRRNWFEEFTGSMTAAENDARDLITNFVKKAMPHRQPALLRHRARYGAEIDETALWAWNCRVLILAKRSQCAGTYSPNIINADWLRALAKESRFDDGPLRAKERLAQAGIPLVIEPHLPQTYFDGAAFLLPDGNPVIGMSLRYDRLDNFWFVLFHELVHVQKHLRKRKLENIFDDLDAEPDSLEQEADAQAAFALIPEGKWKMALARYIRTEKSIESFAEELEIHPAIVAGRIRKEAGNYVILNELVGQGEVRKHFPKVRFGW